MSDAVRLTVQIVGIVFVLFGAYYATYYIGTKASVQNRRSKTRWNASQASNIKLLENFVISKERSFCVIEIAGNVYVIGITNQSMTLLDIIGIEEYELSLSKNRNSSSENASKSGIYGNSLVRKLSSFLANRRSASPETDTRNDAKNESFANSIKSAGEQIVSERRDRDISEVEVDSEGEE